jgi:integrase
MNARNRGIQKPKDSLFTAARAKHLRLARAVVDALDTARRIGATDPFSDRVLRWIPIHAVAPAYLLASTRARWSELASLDAPAVLSGAATLLVAGKWSEDRYVQPFPPAIVPHLRDVPPDAPLSIVDYDTLNRLIQRAQHTVGIELPTRCNNGTHVFRHLYASWRASKGASVEEIARELGHRSKESTLRYIHDSGCFTSLSLNQ